MISIVAFTARGCALAERIAGMLDGRECRVFSKTRSSSMNTERIEGSLSEWTDEAMKGSEALVFVSATGIAVRMIAPFVEDKKTDPAVICLDDNGRFVISLLSGHMGGANGLTAEIASGIGAVPVITTATDVNGKFAIDEFAVNNGMRFRGREVAKKISSKLLNGENVGFRSEYPVNGDLPDGMTGTDDPDTGVLVSSRYGPETPYKDTLILVPQNHVVGIGCRRDIPYENVRSLFCDTLRDLDISPDSVRAVASIDLKKDEPALRELCSEFGFPSVFFSGEELNSMEDIGYSESGFVKSVTTVDCVCERSAIRGSKDGRLISWKTSKDGVTIAVAEESFEITFKEGNK